MDENALQTDESEDENLRAMEKDVDEFLSSLKTIESENSDPQNEDTASKVHDDFDVISSDDCFDKDPLPSTSSKPDPRDYVRRLQQKPFKTIHKRGKRNENNHQKHELNCRYPPKQWHRFNYRKYGQNSQNEYHHQRYFPQKRSLSLRGNYDQEQNISPSERNKHHEARRNFSFNRGNYHRWKGFPPRGRHEYRKRKFYPEELDKFSEDTWSENYDLEAEDNQPWGFEESDPYEDSGNVNAISLITSCLKKAIADNPEIATTVTNACVALLNKPLDEPPESDCEYDRDSWSPYEEKSGRLSPQSWRGSRSPSFARSWDASSSHSELNCHSSRYVLHFFSVEGAVLS